MHGATYIDKFVDKFVRLAGWSWSVHWSDLNLRVGCVWTVWMAVVGIDVETVVVDPDPSRYIHKRWDFHMYCDRYVDYLSVGQWSMSVAVSGPVLLTMF